MAAIWSNGSGFNLLGAMGDAGADNQTRLCTLAARAAATGNAAAPGLMDQCGAARAINVAAGRLVVDAMPPDAALRVNLTDTGRRIIAGTPALAAIAKTLSADVERGFAIGVKVKAALGGFDPAYAARIRAGMSPDNARGFDMAIGQNLAAGGAVNQGAPDEKDTILGLPKAAAIGVGVGLLAAAGLVAYKLTR